MGAAVIAAFVASALGRGDAGGVAAARRARLLLVALLVAALGTAGRQAFSGSDGEPASTPPTIEEADEASLEALSDVVPHVERGATRGRGSGGSGKRRKDEL